MGFSLFEVFEVFEAFFLQAGGDGLVLLPSYDYITPINIIPWPLDNTNTNTTNTTNTRN